MTAGRGDPRTLTVRGKTVRIEGDDEVELRCGEASIVLRSDGSVECRGVNVLTHADELQRIRGAVVKIN